MNWILLALSIVSSCEIFCRLSLLSEVLTVSLNAKKIINVIRSNNISDHWKEIIIPRYSLIMGVASVRFFLEMLIIISPFLIFLTIDQFLGIGFYQFIVNVQVIIFSTIAAIIYLYGRNKFLDVIQ